MLLTYLSSSAYTHYFLFQFGISDVNNLKYVLGTAEKRCQQRKQRIVQADLEREDGEVYNELVYKDSSTFLKVNIIIDLLYMLCH